MASKRIPSRLKTGDMVKFYRNGEEVSGNVMFATGNRITIRSFDNVQCIRLRHEVRRISGCYETTYPEQMG